MQLPYALVVDDEPSICAFIAEVLETAGWQVSQAENAEDAFKAMSECSFDLVFCDVMLGQDDGYEVLRRFRYEQPGARFVLMTGHGSAAGALDATAIGAFDYLVKPFSVSDIIRIADLIRGQLAIRARRDRSNEGDNPSGAYRSDIPLIGSSPRFVECLKMVGRVAPTSLPVLISGDSGTGKEVVANAIHLRSKRANGPFVTINCGAIPDELIESELFGHTKGSFTGANADRVGMWESAASGTIFLDEITETTPQFQVKLLRALQESEIRRVGSNKTIKVDARVIGATNRDIEKEVTEGRFRQDLMYRLNAVTIDLPPLRDRIEDIPELSLHFAERAADGGNVTLSKETINILQQYHWPGNVRELENAILHAVSMADDIVYPEHLPERILSDSGKCGVQGFIDEESCVGLDDMPSLAVVEARYVAKVLDRTGGNKQAAARILNIDRKTLNRILERTAAE